MFPDFEARIGKTLNSMRYWRARFAAFKVGFFLERSALPRGDVKVGSVSGVTSSRSIGRKGSILTRMIAWKISFVCARLHCHAFAWPIFCLIAFYWYAIPLLAQTPSQHRELLEKLEPERQISEVDYGVIWNENELIPNCRENFDPDELCDGRVHHFVTGPVSRNDELQGEFDFLPNEFVNKLSFSLNYGSMAQVKDGCSLGAVRLLEATALSEGDLSESAVFRVTYLSETDPWFLCFHRDNYGVARAMSQSEEFVLSHDVYWFWEGDRIVGNAVCSALGEATNPQCTTNFYLGGGLVRMTIGPFSAVNLRSFLSNLEPITSRFFEGAPIDFSAVGIDVPPFDLPVEVDPEALEVMETIEKLTR